MTDRLRSRRYDVIGKDVECASALLFVQIFFFSSWICWAGGDTREGSSGMGSSRFFFVYIMVLCEITWTPPFSLPLSPFRLSRPNVIQKIVF